MWFARQFRGNAKGKQAGEKSKEQVQGKLVFEKKNSVQQHNLPTKLKHLICWTLLFSSKLRGKREEALKRLILGEPSYVCDGGNHRRKHNP